MFPFQSYVCDLSIPVDIEQAKLEAGQFFRENGPHGPVSEQPEGKRYSWITDPTRAKKTEHVVNPPVVDLSVRFSAEIDIFSLCVMSIFF
jgi:hypothetical protein